MARSIAKGPKPRAGFATVNKNAPKPFVKKAWTAPAQQVTTAKSTEPLGTVQIALLRAQKHGLAKIDARMLLLHTLGKATTDTAWLVANDQHTISAAQADAYGSACARRRAGEPVAYIVGHKAFYGLRLAVDKRVLDPRDDTETLVDWALELLPETAMAGNASPRVLDLGTGSGAIALAIQSKQSQAQVHASDASADALVVAKANAAKLKLAVQFHQGDWFAAVPGQQFGLVVANPPYIAEGDPHLAALAHEPLAALASGPDGLRALAQIIQAAPGHLHPGGWLLLEHGHDQASQVCALLAQKGFCNVQSRADLAGIARCSGGQWQPLQPTA